MADLKNLLLPEKVVTFDFPGCEGLTFDLAFLSKDELVKIQKKATKQKVDKRTRQMSEVFDDELFLELYVQKIVRGWKGFKVEYLREMLLVDEDVDDNDVLDYDQDQALLLMQNSSVFDGWVAEQIGDLGKFTMSNKKKKKGSSKNISRPTTKESVEISI